MSTPDHRVTEREITYHVGRKKGKIQCADTRNPAPGNTGGPHSSKLAGKLEALFGKYVWREAPIPSGRSLTLILWSVPAVCFAAFVWLVVLLRGV